MNSRTHNGSRFDVWHSERTWYWLVINDGCGGGAIGVAASELEAINEARRSIEERSDNPAGGLNTGEVSKRIVACS
jgi:hypothetical protein